MRSLFLWSSFQLALDNPVAEGYVVTRPLRPDTARADANELTNFERAN